MYRYIIFWTESIILKEIYQSTCEQIHCLLIFEPRHEKKMGLMSYANNKGTEQPAHLRSLISTCVVRCLHSIISLDSIAEISRLASFCGCPGWFCVWPVGNSWRHFLSCRGSFKRHIMRQTSIWAMSWENLFLPYANNKGTDQPAHPHLFFFRCLDSIIP